MKRDIPTIFLALKHRKTPIAARLLVGIIIVYALSPIDHISDFIPVLGFLGDVILLPALIAWVIKIIPDAALAECRIEAENLWESREAQTMVFRHPNYPNLGINHTLDIQCN